MDTQTITVDIINDPEVDPAEVLRVFEAEMRAISGKPERSGDGLPN